MKCMRIRVSILAGLLLTGLLTLGIQKSSPAAELPEIDSNRPDGLQTALFALG